jgi:hypothetical protein
MAKATKQHVGAGAQGKHSGGGAMTSGDLERIPENATLSNRDKAQHSDQRGLDGKSVQTEQRQDGAEERDSEQASVRSRTSATS